MTSLASGRADARMRPATARLLAAALVGYGLAGLLALAALGAVLLPTVSALDATVRSSADVGLTLDRTYEAFDGFGASLVQAERSTRGAAQTARAGAETATRIAGAMDINVFGVRPLLPLVSDFEVQARQLDALGSDLDGLTEAIGRDERDVAALKESVRVLRERVRTLDAARPPAALVPLLAVALAWLAMQAVVAVAVGAALWRRS